MFRVLLQSFHKLKLDVSKDDCPFHRVADIVGGYEFLSFIWVGRDHYSKILTKCVQEYVYFRSIYVLLWELILA